MANTLPPTYDRTGRHALTPEVNHDELARFNFLTNLNVHLGQRVSPGNRTAYEKRVKPAFKKEKGREPQTRQDLRKAMRKDPYYQFWAALRRNTMEQRQQSGRHVVLRQLSNLIQKAKSFNDGKKTLRLRSGLRVPQYLAQVDNHCMPGSYYTEIAQDDILAGANYEAGLFITTAGSMSSKGDGGGRSIVNFVKESYPEFSPRRILDLGAGIGVNTLPLAEAYPDAKVVAVDAGAPMVRWGHARAQAMAYTNVEFVHADGDYLDFEPGSFDWVQTTMFWHETSTAAIKSMMKKIRTLMAPGALFLNVEQPNFTPDTPLYDQFTRDWDAWYNNEPFWSKLHVMDVFELMKNAGFEAGKLFDGGTEADIERGQFQPWSSTLSRHKPELRESGDIEHKAYKGERWYLFGAWT